MVHKIVLVRWLDSQMLHEQVDEEDLPEPCVLESVGWLSVENDGYYVLSREHSPHPKSYKWRSSVAIPLAAVVEIKELDVVPQEGIEIGWGSAREECATSSPGTFYEFVRNLW